MPAQKGSYEDSATPDEEEDEPTPFNNNHDQRQQENDDDDDDADESDRSGHSSSNEEKEEYVILFSMLCFALIVFHMGFDFGMRGLILAICMVLFCVNKYSEESSSWVFVERTI
ncbi:hypothetical protein SLEP1_g13580 [Rubroshorea leprosula]|uniref:SAYSvFN domain-containing protein n=1 Tax=Rubroshorea leprosula TaxID=152421 RepID=A0AAV5IQ93_9ROSI|nr:hypothetical protein SLEP1_g13580 [Rubroshorea leprosula]